MPNIFDVLHAELALQNDKPGGGNSAVIAAAVREIERLEDGLWKVHELLQGYELCGTCEHDVDMYHTDAARFVEEFLATPAPAVTAQEGSHA